VRELRGEKIDIITWTDDPRTYIGEALSPAVVDKVGINETEKSALVVVSEQQLSLAIGKKGQNVRLASKLTGWKVDIIDEREYETERAKEREKEISDAISREQDLQKEEAERESESELFEEPDASSEISPESEGKAPLDISDLPGVGAKVAEILKAHEMTSVEALACADEADLTALPTIGPKTALKLIEGAQERLAQIKKGDV